MRKSARRSPDRNGHLAAGHHRHGRLGPVVAPTMRRANRSPS